MTLFSQRPIILAAIAIFLLNFFFLVSKDGSSFCGAVPTLKHGNTTPKSPSRITAAFKSSEEKLAFAMFFSSTVDQTEDLANDKYFISARMLVWQLLHSPRTRSRRNVDVVILVTPSVSESRRRVLEADGAIIQPIDFLRKEWGEFRETRWEDMLAKLRGWEMTQYSRVAMLDTDIILREPIDHIFDDEATQFKKTLSIDNVRNKPPQGAPPLPDSYVLAGVGETFSPEHPFPPFWDGDSVDGGLYKKGYFNGGFLVFSPSKTMFEYFVWMIKTPNSFIAELAEQNLLNVVHDWNGPAPWQTLNSTWNIMYPNDDDLKGGLRTMHQKWFENPKADEKKNGDMVKEEMRRARWEMQGWYDALEASSR
ncbi:glycosyltransferase family 8 protein [Periconia macrospinosa]|uniref:Glycosyltransferase family 8 protein n=1 Tax=Periconia macrospinosa TaxID=97972 RepID=A0A2V1D9F3_9PLEO|nr:glycosyltransferase family 8 protein [Periconia macrospinosa]